METEVQLTFNITNVPIWFIELVNKVPEGKFSECIDIINEQLTLYHARFAWHERIGIVTFAEPKYKTLFLLRYS